MWDAVTCLPRDCQGCLTQLCEINDFNLQVGQCRSEQVADEVVVAVFPVTPLTRRNAHTRLLQRHACRVANSFSHRLIGIICLTRTTNWTTGEATERQTKQTELTERKTDGPNRPTGLTRRRNVTNDENNLFCMQTPFVMCCCNFSSCCYYCCCCFIRWLLLPCLAYAERCCRA